MLRRSLLRRCCGNYCGLGATPTTAIVNNGLTARQLFDGARYALLDCGGTLWTADKPIEGINESLEFMRNELGLQLRFITNNATASRRMMLTEKFHKIGLTSVKMDEIFSSGYAAQVVLRRNGSEGTRYDKGNVLVLGNDGLYEELAPALAPGFFIYGKELKTLKDGYTNCDGELLLKQEAPYDIRIIGRTWNEPLLPPPYSWQGSTHRGRRGVAMKDLGIGAVVVGLDFKFTPTALAIAAMVLQQHRQSGHSRAMFIATNTDPQMPVPGGWLMPGCGSIVAALETASARKPDVVCGKPTTRLFTLFQENELLSGRGLVHPSECVMIGDRLTTDIAFGNAVGCRTVHVETGCETLADIPAEGSMPEAERRAQIPQFAARSLPSIIDAYRGVKRFAVNGKVPGAHTLSAPTPMSRSVLGDDLEHASRSSSGSAATAYSMAEVQRKILLGQSPPHTPKSHTWCY
jgi:4-nitrophenyl phosphatase